MQLEISFTSWMIHQGRSIKDFSSGSSDNKITITYKKSYLQLWHQVNLVIVCYFQHQLALIRYNDATRPLPIMFIILSLIIHISLWNQRAPSLIRNQWKPLAYATASRQIVLCWPCKPTAPGAGVRLKECWLHILWDKYQHWNRNFAVALINTANICSITELGYWQHRTNIELLLTNHWVT